MISLAALSLLTATQAPAQAPLVSPEVRPDKSVTFRFRDPRAEKVDLSLEGSAPLPMAKGEDGVWICTTKPLAPDIYGYSFNADGETRLDPRNPLTKPNLLWSSNMVVVPGDRPELWEVRDVPRGSVHHHFYRSAKIGDHRDYFVYTPPRYRPSERTKYPVLYLLHGYSDTANGWTEVGRAHVILDNLIADGKVRPMLVVMPLGYGVPGFASPNRGFRDPALVKRNYDDFRTALLTEVMPRVEHEYGASTDRRQRAIAGLSMGGAESLYVGLSNIDKFAYVGAFSSGGLSSDLATAFPDFNPPTANRQLRRLWISCGTEDGLIAFHRQLVSWLGTQGVRFTAQETPGAHTWMVWRRNLASFTQTLWKG